MAPSVQEEEGYDKDVRTPTSYTWPPSAKEEEGYGTDVRTPIVYTGPSNKQIIDIDVSNGPICRVSMVKFCSIYKEKLMSAVFSSFTRLG